MEIKNMTPEQRREYNRNAKRKERAKQEAKDEAERLRTMALDADDYVIPEPQQKTLTKYSNQFMEAVQAELGELSDRDRYTVSGIAEVIFGLENNTTREVQ